MKVITFFTFLAGIAATYAVALPSAESKRELHSTTSISLPETHSHSKRLESFTVYVCNDPFFEGPCIHLVGAAQECRKWLVPLKALWYKEIDMIIVTLIFKRNLSQRIWRPLMAANGFVRSARFNPMTWQIVHSSRKRPTLCPVLSACEKGWISWLAMLTRSKLAQNT